jgi:hypothetical protein
VHFDGPRETLLPVTEEESMKVSIAVPVAVATTLLVASGGAFAASRITGAQIKDGTITSADVKNRSLSSSDMSAGALSALRGNAGPAGPQGPAGPAGVAAVTRVFGATVSQGAFGSGLEVQTSTATCPAGTYVTGGGYRTGSIEDIVSFALSSPTQYSVIAVNEFNQIGSITAQAMCAGGAGVVASRAHTTTTPAAVLRRAAELQQQLDSNRH